MRGIMSPTEAAVLQEFHPNKGIEKYIAMSGSLSVWPSVYMSALKNSRTTEEVFMKNAVGDLK
jgi:hypothetical protein